MPTKPKRPCSHPGCPKLTDGRYCQEHQLLENKRYEKYDRDPAVKKRYGRAWKRIRDRYIAQHPLCEQCLKQNKVTAAEEVHHILPLSRGGTHCEDNLMSLCTPCHSKITATEGGRWTPKKRDYHKGQPLEWWSGQDLNLLGTSNIPCRLAGFGPPRVCRFQPTCHLS